jgi:hypothetical protein
MAFASSGKFFLRMTYEDSGNNLSKTEVQIDAADIAAAEVLAAANINDFVNTTKAYIKSYSVSEEFTNGAARTPGGEVEEKAVITLQLTDITKKAILTIPAPVDTLFSGVAGTDGWNRIDTADSLVQALAGDFVSDFFISDGEHIAATPGSVLKGKRTHRSSSRG